MSKEAYNKILSKLQRLDEYLGYLKTLQKVGKDQFLADFRIYGLVERYMQLSIEILLDVGKLLVVARNFRRPDDNSDILHVLGENKIISKKLEADLFGIANFRNILVHDYEKIDRFIVYAKLKNNLADFAEFKKQILKYMNKK